MELKPLNKNAISSAMEKARHYRLLNDPVNSESICRDILEHDAGHQQALITLILSIADQFNNRSCKMKEPRSLVGQLASEYDRAYYAGLMCEKAARSMVSRTSPGSNHSAYDLFREALEHFEKAESLSPDDNDDAVLRWNACVRTINKRKLKSRPEDNYIAYGD